MAEKYNITKCVCYDTTFEEMKRTMEVNKITTLEQLLKIKTVASNCRLCLPYIEKMIKTGRTKFDVIIE